MRLSRPLPITGLGTVSAAGMDAEALARTVLEGRSALSRRSRIPHALVDPGWTGTVPDGEPVALGELPEEAVQARCVAWAVRAARTAMDQARVRERIAPGRIALVLGSNLECHPQPLSRLADRIARALGIEGPALVTSMACASSLAAMNLARVVLEAGDADAVLVGGSDVLTPRVAGGFRQLDLLGERPCAPFSQTTGVALGEGAALFVLEAAVDPQGPAPVVFLLGEGLAADAHHETSPEPRGRGTVRALGDALARAGVDASQLDLVMAHATGTEANDAAEARGLRRCLGEALERIEVGAAKSLLGHAQGAAGALELAAALLGRAADALPPIANFEHPPRADAPPRLVVEPTRGTPRRIAVDGAGFGGAHASVIVGEPVATPQQVRVAPTRPGLVAWAGLGWFGSELAALPEARKEGRTIDQRFDADWRRVVRGVDLRAHDPSTRMLTAVVHQALRRARTAIELPSRPRQAVGLCVGQRASSSASRDRLWREIETHGIARTQASTFVEPLEIMPAGACSRYLELWGPLGLVCAEASAGLLAVLWAVHMLAQSEEVEAIVASCVNEQDATTGSVPDGGDAAAALVVGIDAPIELCGGAMTGPGETSGDAALASACERAGTAVGEVELVHRVRPERTAHFGAAAGGLAMATAADALLGRDPGSTAAVVACDPGVEVALVIRRRETPSPLAPPRQSG